MRRQAGMEKAGRRIAALLLTLLAVLGTALQGGAGAEEKRTVRVGYYITPGFQEYDEDTGVYSGYGYEYLMALSQWAGWQYELVPVTFAQGMEMLEKGELDLMNNVSITQERQETLLFSQLASGENQAYLAGDPSSQVAYEDYAAISKLTVGLVRTSIYSQKFLSWCISNGCTPACRWFETKEEAIAAMQEGTIGARIITSSQNVDMHIIASFAPEAFYFACPKTQAALMQELDRAMNSLKTSDPAFESRLTSKYYGNAAQTNTVLTAEEQTYAAQAGSIALLYDPDFYPISATDENGALKGAAGEIFARVTAETGLAFAPIACTGSALEETVRGAQTDMVLGLVPYDYGWATAHGVRLMQPVLDISVSLLRQNGGRDGGRTLAVVSGSYLETLAQDLYGDEFDYLPLDTTAECLAAVLDGRADVTCVTTYESEYFLSQSRYRALIASVAPRLSYSMAAAVTTGSDSRLYTILQKAFSAISADELDGIVTGVMQQVQSPDALTMLLDHPEILVSAGLVLVALLAGLTSLGVYVVLARRRNRAISRKNELLAEALSSADEANHARNDFMARMSHEIRTPMNAIVGLTAIAQAHAGEPKRVRDCTQKIASASQTLLSILSDVLDMSAIESKRLQLASEPFDMETLLAGLEREYAGACGRKGVRFVRTGSVAPEALTGDAERLTQVLGNLLSNACKFTEPGGQVELGVQEQTREAGQVYLRFTVSDTGCGMSEELLEKAFQPFEKGDAAMSAKTGSTGLGLSIAYHLVQLMRGGVSVRSEQGVGTTFTLDIPFGLIAPVEASACLAGACVRALVVDGDESAREYAALMLDGLGVRCDTAKDGAAALAALSQAQQAGDPFTLCLMDVALPDMDGLALMRRIRETYPQARVAVVTAFELAQVREDALSAGAVACLSKPLMAQTLRELLERLTGGRLQEKPREEPYDFTGFRVLLAEDNDLNAEIASELLKMANMAVERACDGAEAVEMFERAPAGTYCAVLMDIQMPVMDGYAAARRIRASARPDSATIPILAMTANALPKDVSDALQSGMNGHIAKPIDTGLLYESLRRAIGGA